MLLLRVLMILLLLLPPHGESLPRNSFVFVLRRLRILRRLLRLGSNDSSSRRVSTYETTHLRSESCVASSSSSCSASSSSASSSVSSSVSSSSFFSFLLRFTASLYLGNVSSSV